MRTDSVMAECERLRGIIEVVFSEKAQLEAEIGALRLRRGFWANLWSWL